MVTLFVPGVGEEDLDGIERGGGNAVAQHFHRVMTVHTDVSHTALGHAVQHFPHAGAMHLNADEIRRGRCRSHLDKGLPHTEADFQHPRRVATKRLLVIERTITVQQAEARPVSVPGALLAGGKTPHAQYVAANGALAVVTHQPASFQLAAARQPQAAINDRPPSGAMAPSQRRPDRLST